MAVAHAFYCHKRINIVKGAVSIAFFCIFARDYLNDIIRITYN